MDSGTSEGREAREQTVDELRTDLQTCRAENEDAERRADRYLASAEEMETLAYAVAHDLKSPLRSMLSFTQLLTRRLPDDPDIREYAGHIISGATEMQAVIDAVQKLANVARPKRASSRTTIRLNVILQLALLGLQSKLNACGAEVHFENLPEVTVDESQFGTMGSASRNRTRTKSSVRFCACTIRTIRVSASASLSAAKSWKLTEG